MTTGSAPRAAVKAAPPSVSTSAEVAGVSASSTVGNEEEARQGLRWLAQLRWFALAGAMVGVLLAMLLDWRFVSTEAVMAGVVVMALVNVGLEWRARRGVSVSMRELGLHAAVDLLLLTWL